MSPPWFKEREIQYFLPIKRVTALSTLSDPVFISITIETAIRHNRVDNHLNILQLANRVYFLGQFIIFSARSDLSARMVMNQTRAAEPHKIASFITTRTSTAVHIKPPLEIGFRKRPLE